MGMTVDKEYGNTMEVDDLCYVWSKSTKKGGIMQAVRWAKKKFPDLKLRLGDIEKQDLYNYRCYPSNSCKYYDDSKGLNCNNVGLVYVTVNEFRYENNDPKYGEKLFYYDNEWSK